MIPKSGRHFPDCAKPGKGLAASKPRPFCHSDVRRLLIAAVLLASIASVAVAEESSGDCLGIGFEVTHPVTIAKIIADRSQVRFVKSAYDDPACPAERDTCAQTSYLVPGDLALVGKTHGAYSCVSYQSPPIARSAGPS